MRLFRKCLFALLASLCAAPVMSSVAAFPDRPVHFIVGFPAGGGTDLLARFVGQNLSLKWKQPVIVENHPGADGSIAADLVAHAPRDGYSVAWVSNAHTITPNQFKLNYDPIRSFTPLTIAASIPNLFLINQTVSAKTLKDFIAYAKANPGKLNFGSPGTGTSAYLDMIDFMARTGISMEHIPYKGSAPAHVALLGNDIQVRFGVIASTLSDMQVGKVSALAISSATRSKFLPDIPTIAEAADLPGFNGGVWYGALAPAGVPKNVADKVAADMIDAIHAPSVQDEYAKLGFESAPEGPDEMSAEMRREISKWGKLIAANPAK